MLATERARHTRDLITFDQASARTFDADGRMHVTGCRISKANVCPYLGREIPDYVALGLDANRVYMLYRDPEELKLAADSFCNAPLLIKHKRHSARDSLKDLTAGTVGRVTFDGMYLVSDRLSVWTEEGIKLIQTEEQRELSSGYRFAVDMTSGFDPDGHAFDGRMIKIRGNHVTLVRDGRAGSDVCVNDSLPSELSRMKYPKLIEALKPYLMADADALALDAMLASIGPEDEDEDDPENPGKRRKKINPGKGEPTKAGGALATDEAIQLALDTRVKAGEYVSKADATKMANDAAAEAVKRVNNLNAARKAVEPLVGVVTMDSAEEVYRFALGKEGVALDGVDASAFPALVAARLSVKNAASSAVRGTSAPSLEASAAVAAALPGLGRVTRL